MRNSSPVAAFLVLLTLLWMPGCSDSNDMVVPPGGDAPCTDETGNRFQECEDAGNGTVTDTDTDLIWLKAADCFDREGFDDARAAVAELEAGQCGLSDGSTPGAWRLPTKEEWEAIVRLDCTFGSPHLPNRADDACWSEDNPFTGVLASSYWSSTDGSSSSYAWIVYLHDAFFIPDDKNETNWVWPVRSP